MLMPADSYQVINKSIITDVDKKVLIDLYQVIIGSASISLYNVLLSSLNDNILGEEVTHHSLVTSLGMGIKDILSARERLEGIGLLKTYLKEDNSSYVYVLYSPLSYEDFFNHPILNVVLYNNLGKKEYEKLVSKYELPKVGLKGYKDVSLAFDEVFGSINPEVINNFNVRSRSINKLDFKQELDFDLIISGLSLNEKIFNEDVKYLLNSLSFIYNIDTLTMQNLIRSTLNEKGSIDKESLRKSIRSYYTFENRGNLPTLIYRKQPEYLKTKDGGTSSKAKMIHVFENTNPYEFLKSKYKDGKVINRDLVILESLLIDLKLTPGVVNVLVDYVLKTNNMKLNKAYIETIGSSWKRLGIETVVDAMERCIKEYKKIPKSNTKSIKKESDIVPEWFNQRIEKKELSLDEENELKDILANYN